MSISRGTETRMTNDVDLFNDYIDYLERKQIAFADRYIPYYLCSVGCHMLNIKQYKRNIYPELGRYPDLRLNTMMVAPPGFSKTFFMELMLDPEIGIVGGGNIPTRMVQNMTEAAFIGSDGGGEDDEYEPGVAEQYKEGIVGCEEFDTLIQVMQTDHSSNLDNMLLTALDSGRVRKDLANAEINYDTNITLYAATQPLRMDLTSGFARRFLFMKFYPSPEEMDQIRNSRRRGRGMDADFSEIQKFRKKLGMRLDTQIAELDEIRGVNQLDSLFDNMGVPHYEEPIYERMAMGYSILKSGTIENDAGTTYLQVEPTRELRHLVRQAMQWRQDMMRDPEGDQVVSVLKGTEDGEMELNDLKEYLRYYSLDYSESQQIIKRLQKNHQVKVYKPGGNRNEEHVKLINA